MQSHVSENLAEIALVAVAVSRRRRRTSTCTRATASPVRARSTGTACISTESDFAFLHETGTAIAHCPTSNNFLGSGLVQARRRRSGPTAPCASGLATDLGGGTSFSILRTMQAAYEVAQLSGTPLPPSCALYLATRGAAHALDLDDRIGSVAPGMEADLVVLDLHSTPLARRCAWRHAKDIDEALAVQMALGDDRAVRATYVAGKRAYDRDAREFASVRRSASAALR